MTKEVLGKPYPTDRDYKKREGKGPNKFDCSGGITWVLKKMGYDIEPWMINANNLMTNRKYTTNVSKDELNKGDIIGWDWEGDGYWDHVTVISNWENGTIFHASSGKGINEINWEKTLDNWAKKKYSNYKKKYRRIKW